MHVTLIHPPMFFFKENDILCPQCLGLLYLAASLKAAKINVHFIDSVFEGYNNVSRQDDGLFRVGLSTEQIISKIQKTTGMIAISLATTYHGKMIVPFISMLRNSFPSVPIVLGGVYPSTLPDLAIKSGADFICLGEGELALVQLVEYLQGFRPLPQGILSTKDKLPKNLEYTYPKNLDLLTFPARDIIPFVKYMRISPVIRGYNTAVLSSSRGCPFKCNFCANHPMNGYLYRARSSKNILLEIEQLISLYSVNQIDFVDDNFTLDKTRVIEILNGIIEINKRKKIFWSASNGIRIDTLDEELFSKFAESNCRHITLALEHGSQKMLNMMHKELLLEKALLAVNLAKKYKIPTDICIIYGYPGETRELFEEGLSFYRQLRKIYPLLGFIILAAQPYPGTELYKECKLRNYLSVNFDQESFLHTNHTHLIQTPDFDHIELLRRVEILRKELGLTSYFRVRLKNILSKWQWSILKKIYFEIDTRILKILRK